MELVEQIPYGAQALAIVVAIASIVSAAVSDEKLGPFAKVVNFLAANFGKARNDPSVQ